MSTQDTFGFVVLAVCIFVWMMAAFGFEALLSLGYWLREMVEDHRDRRRLRGYTYTLRRDQKGCWLGTVAYLDDQVGRADDCITKSGCLRELRRGARQHRMVHHHESGQL